MAKVDLITWYRRLTPVIALGTGLVAVFYIRRGASFAPVAVGALIAAWGLAAVVSGWNPKRPKKKEKVARAFGSTVVAGLYQMVLFFLLPLWFGSASWDSANIAAPIVLTAMALFSCFEAQYERGVWSWPRRRAAWSAVLLFATAVPALVVVTSWPLGWALGFAAAAAVLAAAAFALPWSMLREPRTAAVVFGASMLAALSAQSGLQYLPPVPIQALVGNVAEDVVDKEPVSIADTFVGGTPRIYAHFAVVAPPRYAQQVVFHWFRNGKLRGKPFSTSVVGGRQAGFRTWAYVSKPRAGRWRVDLTTPEGQLIGRRRFRVAE